jgi:hypothetical protein
VQEKPPTFEGSTGTYSVTVIRAEVPVEASGPTRRCNELQQLAPYGDEPVRTLYAQFVGWADNGLRDLCEGGGRRSSSVSTPRDRFSPTRTSTATSRKELRVAENSNPYSSPLLGAWVRNTLVGVLR